MKYFHLSDDVHIPTRWHLGEVLDASGSALDLLHAKRVSDDIIAQVEVHHLGIELDFCLTSFAVPVIRATIERIIERVAGKDVQFLPLDIRGHEGFEVLNPIQLVKCLDENRSDFTKWTDKDHRADLAGQYRMVTNLKIDASQIPSTTHVFRIEGWPIALIVSEKVKGAMEYAGCLGAKFTDVT